MSPAAGVETPSSLSSAASLSKKMLIYPEGEERKESCAVLKKMMKVKEFLFPRESNTPEQIQQK